jgi:hypothetical protein
MSKNDQNDPGPIRGVIEKKKNLMGAICHPEDNPSGFKTEHIAAD